MANGRGRPRKKDLDYFDVRCDFFSNEKIRLLIAKFGCKAVAVYLYILCRSYGFQHGYFMERSEDMVLILSCDLGINYTDAEEIIDYAITKEIFTQIETKKDGKDIKIITSYEIQDKYQQVTASYGRKVEVRKDVWILSPEDTMQHIVMDDMVDTNSQSSKISVAEDDSDAKKESSTLHSTNEPAGTNGISPRKNTINPEENTFSIEKNAINPKKNTQKKRNKKKEKETTIDVYDIEFFSNSEVDKQFKEYLQMRIDKKFPLTERAIKGLLTKLQPFDTDVQLHALNEAIIHEWRSVFPKPDNQNKKNIGANAKMSFADVGKEMIERANNNGILNNLYSDGGTGGFEPYSVIECE